VKGLGGLFKKIGAHAKRKASEVASQTAQNIAAGASNVVDTSIETGAGVVSGAALEATNTARSTIGGVGRSLTPVALRGGESSDNLATVMAGGGAELRMLRFTGNTDVLEPASRDLIKRLAAALNATQGRFVIEAHVDPLPSPAASQLLSEHRAAAVKQGLIRNGVEAARLTALGYGASEPKPEVPPEGGPPSSNRIVMVREAVATH
jgi:outer membrane protein OmpA-like peptidoglycan-associated protein